MKINTKAEVRKIFLKKETFPWNLVNKLTIKKQNKALTQVSLLPKPMFCASVLSGLPFY